MPKTGKIDQHQLGQRILDMVCREQRTTHEVANILKAEGYSISQPTVARWLKERREESAGKAQTIFQEHIERELPKDLEALEGMEALLLAWARETPDKRAERITVWEKVYAALEGILGDLEGLRFKDGKEKLLWAQGFVAQALKWLMEDYSDQKSRRAAMKLTAEIITIKLRFAGIIEGSESGNIIIRPAESGKSSQSPDGSAKNGQGGRLVLVRGGQDA
ncbi:MAG: hypothetical protein KKB20_10725 [Proteobacteria bacterium]|nr:hypothetical protein [Pseudomonadota bacterium]